MALVLCDEHVYVYFLGPALGLPGGLQAASQKPLSVTAKPGWPGGSR